MPYKTLNRFDRIAPYYNGLAKIVFGNAINKAQLCNLELIKPHARVLVLGGGSGYWLNELMKNNDKCQVWFIEASSVMLNKAKHNLRYANRITFIHGTQDEIPDIMFDAIVTHFFVDMFNEIQLSVLARQIKSLLNKDGLWLVADFVDQKFWHKSMLWIMYLFFRLTGAIAVRALPAWDRVICEQSFKNTISHSYYGGFMQCHAYTIAG